MGFSTMLDILKDKDRGKIIFVKLGTFYVAVGEDAVLLHNKLGKHVSMSYVLVGASYRIYVVQAYL